MEHAGGTEELAAKLKAAALRRKGLASGFPSALRDSAAADLLERLANDLPNVDPHVGAIFRQVQETADRDLLKRTEDEMIAAIGFSYEPRTITALVRALSWGVVFRNAGPWKAPRAPTRTRHG